MNHLHPRCCSVLALASSLLITLTPPGHATVRVGIWDTGVDVDLFEGRIYVNPGETPDGMDNDGNGFIDDIHGIAFDEDHEKSPDLLVPLGEKPSRRVELRRQIKGLFDLQAAIGSPESSQLKQKLATLQPQEVETFLEDLMLYALYVHGTHVAGTAIDGNPRAEIVVARLGTGPRLIPAPRTIEDAKKLAREFQETVDYFKASGTRVVNMSWVLSAKGFEDDLEKNGIGESAAERIAMARELFAIAKEGLRSALASAPEILFVGGAGSAGRGVAVDDLIPPSFRLPNLIIAGAVDRAGDGTSFTRFGRSVEVYANGFEVDSVVPGGQRMKLSGPSMASPNVVNLAAKLLAIDPSLSPPEVIELIKAGAEKRGKKMPVLVIDPKRSVELLEERLRTTG